jgi:hypothetical protein
MEPNKQDIVCFQNHSWHSDHERYNNYHTSNRNLKLKYIQHKGVPNSSAEKNTGPGILKEVINVGK